MAVLTKIPEAELKEILENQYNILPITKITGILEGVENTNYKVTTSTGDYIFTLIERRLDLQGLQRCLELMYHMYYNGIPCPLPVHQVKDSKITAHVHFDKPACVVTFMPGKSLGETAVNSKQFYSLGAVCARIHSSSLGAAVGMPPNPLGKDGILALADTLKGKFGEENTKLVNNVIESLKKADLSELKTGLCHGDLFPDNVFFEDDRVSGVIDWYFACTDTLAYDLAIVLSAWCFSPNAEHFIKVNAEEILEGYNSVRPLTPHERAALPLLCQLAALRFYLTRLQDSLTPRGGALIDKDPNEYAAKLAFFKEWKGL